MQEIRKSVIKYDSASENNVITGYFYEAEQTEIKAVLQICHGMREYIARYDDFAAFMAKNGFAVCGNDHLGHGQTSDGANGIDGYFAKQNATMCVLQDILKMNELARQKYQGLPVIMLGHSMGSFFARVYAGLYHNTIEALIISGTSSSNPLSAIGKLITSILSKTKGDEHRSLLLENMSFGSYNKMIKNPKTKYDWLTNDEAIVNAYAQDKKCTCIFTVNGFATLLDILTQANSTQCAQALRKDMPVLIFSGADDPVGGYGKGVAAVCELIKNAGVKNVEFKIYNGARHEVLNELGKDEAYKDILNWCNNTVAGTIKTS